MRERMMKVRAVLCFLIFIFLANKLIVVMKMISKEEKPISWIGAKYSCQFEMVVFEKTVY